jgi:KTSC domain
MQYYSVSSSSISEVGYDESSSTLAVRFQTGSEYHYFGVPESEFQSLRFAASVGTYLNTQIKTAGYAYAKIS